MLKTVVLGSLLVAAVGCGSIETELDRIPVAGKDYAGPQAEMPGQTLALGIVWYQAFGAAADWIKPPTIKWRQGDTCTDKFGTHENTFRDTGTCNLGEFSSTYDYATIEWQGCFSCNQTFAHELGHAFAMYLTGDADSEHAGPSFNGPHNDIGWKYQADLAVPLAGAGSLVDRAENALVAAGF